MTDNIFVTVRKVCPYCHHARIVKMNTKSFIPELKPSNRIDTLDNFECKEPCSYDCPVENCICWKIRFEKKFLK